MRHYLRVANFLHSIDYQPLHSFLLEPNQILSDSIVTQGIQDRNTASGEKAILDLMEDAGRAGLLDDYFQPKPQVEE
jgi:hypothetical protein